MPTKSKSIVFRQPHRLFKRPTSFVWVWTSKWQYCALGYPCWKPWAGMVFGSPRILMSKKFDTNFPVFSQGWLLVVQCRSGHCTWHGPSLSLGGNFWWTSVDPNKRGSRKTPGGLGVTSKPPPCFSLDLFLKRSADLFRFRKNPRKRKEELSFR